MGKKGKWFLAIKSVLTCSSSKNLGNESVNKGVKEKRKKGLGKRKYGEGKKFIPLFREPSSIEKILGDAEREHHKLIFKPPSPLEQPKTPPAAHSWASSPRITSPRIASPRVTSPRVASPRVASFGATSPRAVSPRVTLPKVIHHQKDISDRTEPTLSDKHVLATKIQTAYRGYKARRSLRALKGMVRLQAVVRGQNVKRQVVNATKRMQLFVRVQAQIQLRRTQMLEDQATQHQSQYRHSSEVESTFGKWSQTSEAGNHEDWDDSVLTKEERDARMQRKVEAAIKRERAMAYAHSHQLSKTTSKSAQSALIECRLRGFPWWWNWLDRQLPLSIPLENQAMKDPHLTPPRSAVDQKPRSRPQSRSSQKRSLEFDAIDAITPKSTRSSISPSIKQARTPSRFSEAPTPNRTPNSLGALLSRRPKPRPMEGYSPFSVASRDDDSLMSCPPFSSPSYMAPTISAKAKMRATVNSKESYVGTPRGSECSRRSSFPPSPGIRSLKWHKGSFGKDHSVQSVENRSVDSPASLPAGVGRKPFNRFV